MIHKYRSCIYRLKCSNWTIYAPWHYVFSCLHFFYRIIISHLKLPPYCSSIYLQISLEKYVIIMSAPARFIEIICSITTCFSSIHPLSAAAFVMLYSPLTLYAITGTFVVLRTSLIMSKKLKAGLTIIMSAPSCKSLSSSLSASLLFAGSILYVLLSPYCGADSAASRNGPKQLEAYLIPYLMIGIL